MSEDVALEIPISADVNPLKTAMSEVKTHVSGAMDGLKSALGGIKDAFGAAGIIAAGYLKGAIESAAKAEEKTERLKTLVENQGETWDKAEGQVKTFTSGIMKMSTFSGGEAKEALTTLAEKGMNLSDGLKLQNTLVDLAAGKNMDLTSAANILSDAYHGKTKALVGLGLATKEEIKNGISFEDVVKKINDRFGGAAAGELNTYAGQMKQFGNNMNSLKTTIGSYILPYLSDLAKYLNTVAQHLSALDPHSKQIIAAILAATAVLGTLIGGVGLFSKIMGVLGPVVSGIGTIIGGLTLPVIAVVAGIALLTAAYLNNWGGMRDKTNEVISFIKPLIIDSFNAIVSWVKEHWPEIKAVIETVLKAIESAWNNILKPVLKFILDQLGVVVKWIQDNWPLIQKTIETIIKAVKAFIEPIIEALVEFWKEHGETIITHVKYAFDIIKTVIETVIHIVLDILKTVMQLITGDWKGAWDTVCDIVKTLFTGVIKIIKDILGDIGNIFGDIAKTAVKWGEGLINGFIDGIMSKVNAVKDAVGSVINGAKKFLGFNSPSEEGEGQHIVEWGANMIGGFMDGIKSQIPNMQKLMNSVIKAPSLSSNINFGINGNSGNGLVGAGSVNIIIELDGTTIARAIGQPLVNEIRVRTGLKI